MKKLLLTLGAVIVLSLLVSPASFAQDDELPDPGLTPDSPFYFLDDLWKSIRLTFTRNINSQTELRLEFALEKIAEMQQMAEEGKDDAIARARLRYEEHLTELSQRLDSANLTEEQQARVEERLAAAAERHQGALDQIQDRSNRALEHVEGAWQKAHEHKVEALERLAEHRPERAGQLTVEAFERMIAHLEEALQQPDLTDEKRARIEKRLARLQELQALGGVVSGQLDEDNNLNEEEKENIRGLLLRNGQQAIETLERVLNQVPEEARPAIQRALERIRAHQSATSSNATIEERRAIFENLRHENEERFRDLRESRESEFCIQVITPARNPETGEIRNFPTPCDVPGGWERVFRTHDGVLRDRLKEDIRVEPLEPIRDLQENIIPTEASIENVI